MNTLGGGQWRSLQAVLPTDAFVTDPVELITYELDASLGHGGPHAVILPRHTQDVVTLMRWAREHKVPVVARGAGTGLSGGAVATHGGVIVSFARMKSVVELDEEGRSVVVQPGMIHQTLDEFVKTRGLYYPPDPASGRACTLGGNFGENAGGPHCFKYGVTTNYVNGLTAVLADGTVLHTGGRAFDYPEYDLTGLLVGSEGTLGIVTEAQLRLVRNIPGIKTLMAIFDSVEEAGIAVSAVIARGLVPATLEMMDRNMIGIVEAYAHAGLPTDAEALLIIEADGHPESLDGQMAEIVQVMEECKARELRMAQNAAERDKIWYARKSAFGAIAQISPAYLIVDGTVLRSTLADVLAQINAICTRHDLRVGYVFHAGDGNLHPLIMFDPRDTDMVRRVHAAGDEVMALCVRMGGTITGEHGVGSEKREYMRLMYTPAELHAMRDIKETFDPDGLLNPGKILPEPLPALEWPLIESTPRLPERLEPHSAEEAAEMVASWAAERPQRTLRVQGSGTKSGQLPPTEMVLSTCALRGVRTLSTSDLYIAAGAGTTVEELQAEAGKVGMWVPLGSPWPHATLGGILSTNYNAPLRSRYGAVRDLTLALNAVLPDGRLLRLGRPVMKNVAGYDLVKLFIGAHGTLGLITDVALKLMPLPRLRQTIAVPVDDLPHAVRLGQRLLRVAMISSSVLLCHNCDIAGIASPYAVVYTAEGVPEDVHAELGQVCSALRDAGAAAPCAVAASGVEIWQEWLRSGYSAGTPTVRVGVAPKDLARVLIDLAPVLDGASWLADVPTGLVYAAYGLAGPPADHDGREWRLQHSSQRV